MIQFWQLDRLTAGVHFLTTCAAFIDLVRDPVLRVALWGAMIAAVDNMIGDMEGMGV